MADLIPSISRALGWPYRAGGPRVELAAEESAADSAAALVQGARGTGVVLQPVGCSYGELPSVLDRLGPAIVRLSVGQQVRYLAVLASVPAGLTVLTPALVRRHITAADLCRQVSAPLEAPLSDSVDVWLSTLNPSPRRAARARRSLLSLLLEGQSLSGLYLLRLDPGSPFDAQLRTAGAAKLLAGALALSLAQVALTFLGWFVIGREAALGSVRSGWTSAWVLALLTAVLLQVGALWLGGLCVHRVSLLLKQRLLAGALRLEPDGLRRRGSGRLLALAFECSTLEAAGPSGPVSVSLSLLQLLGAFFVIALGAGGSTQSLLLVAWCGVCGVLAWTQIRLRSTWSDERLGLARQFVESVLGHRTRLAQQPSERWHSFEDQALTAHVGTSAALDRAQTRLAVVPARGWLLLGVMGLAPVMLTASPDPADLVVAIGGVLQAYVALQALTRDVGAIGGAVVAWTKVKELFVAGRLPQPAVRCAAPALPCRPIPTGAVAVDLQGVSYCYAGHSRPILRDCRLRIQAGERVLLEGASGAGKSTLGALIAGLREPESGHILVGGLDRASVGASHWLRRVACAPQFHENYLFSAPLAFNLLLSRGWPPTPRDLEEAHDLCKKLGLDALVRKMPCGLNQVVGETGWQLSHGERSRVFLARALLQCAEVVVLDETFAALDAVTVDRCVETVLAQASTLLIVAHP